MKIHEISLKSTRVHMTTFRVTFGDHFDNFGLKSDGILCQTVGFVTPVYAKSVPIDIATRYYTLEHTFATLCGTFHPSTATLYRS